MSKVLVMGGSTFVSSNMAQFLISKNYKVDILTRGKKDIPYEGYNEHIVCDRRVYEEVKEKLKDKFYDYIIDISAYTKEDVSILLDAVDKNNLKKYVFCSSGAVYKATDDLITEEYEKEENPNWGKYGTDKLEAENYIISRDIPYMIFRPTYIYGKENNLYREGYFFDRLLENKVIPIPGIKDTVTQFIHIEDLVKVFESAMISKCEKRVYNVTHPELVTWNDLVKSCESAVNKNSRIKKVKDKVESRRYFPFRDVTYTLDISRLIDDGLFVPQLKLEEGLKKTFSWYKNSGVKLEDKRMTDIEHYFYEGE